MLAVCQIKLPQQANPRNMDGTRIAFSEDFAKEMVIYRSIAQSSRVLSNDCGI